MVAITGSSSDSLSGVESVQVSVDAGSPTPATGTTSWSFTTNSLADGSHTLTVNVMDRAGNIGSTSVAVTVDTTPPQLTLPSDVTAEATGPSGVLVIYTVTAADSIDGSVTPSCTPASGFAFPLGTTTVNCSATDSAANTASGSFHVTVQDTTPPALTLPANITTEATGPGGATVSFSVSASDLVDGVILPSCSPTSGSMFAIGTTVVNCSAIDAHGSVGSGSF